MTPAERLVCIDAAQLRAALEELDLAESRGFSHSLAVFRCEQGRSPMMLSDKTATYSDIWERSHPTSGRQDWGRDNFARRTHRVVDGRLVLLEPGDQA